MLRELGTKVIPPEELARIAVPTTLIWGRYDRVMRLRIAVRASARYGWPLHVIEDAGHFAVEQPEAFRRALRAALGTPEER
jgi:pimeloyl-ACP methyl ester carboxylesterase